MSTLEGLERFGLSEFGGAKSLIDPIDLAPGDALVAQNCKFSPGRVHTREGFAVHSFSLTRTRGSPFYWAQGQTGVPLEYLAWVERDNSNDYVVVQNLSTGTETTILTLANTGATSFAVGIFASSGPRLYLTLLQFPNSAVVNSGLPYVWDGNTSNQMIACFQRPMKTTEVTEALTQPGAGVVTAGTHYVGVLFQTKAGYWTKPGPANASTLVLVPQSIVSTGTNNIRVTLTPATTWPTWIQAVQVIMTTAANDYQYYVVAGTITPVTSGSATVYTIDISVADEHLTSTGSQGAGTLADDYFGLLSMNASNAQPFSVKFVLPWGQRMVWCVNYGGIDCFFPSDPLNPESISADRSIQQLPGAKPFGSAFVLHGVLNVVSSGGGMYAFVDNGGNPADFSPCGIVDEKLSVVGPGCCVTSSGGGYALIAAVQGFYSYTGGALPSLPFSYEQTPVWNSIDWPSYSVLPLFGYHIQALDYGQERTAMVYVYMQDDSRQVLTWAYDAGIGVGKAKYSNWTSALFGPSRMMEVVRYSGTWLLFWATGLIIYRQRSARAEDSASTLYSDNSSGIDWQYQTAPLPKLDDSPMLQHLALRLRARALTGTPSIYFSAKSLDNVRTITMPLSPLALSVSPGREWTAFYDAQEERISYLFTNNNVAGAGISIARLTHFYTFFAEQR